MPASTFSEILKFNPYHDANGRFSTSGTAASFTYAPGKSKAHDLAIERQKERMAAIMPTAAQDKTLRSIASRTRNLRNEQFRVVDRDGNVVMEKKGDRTSVSYSIGEARDNFPGNITIHNHPDGGTFSTADLSDIGYGATEIRAAAPEGTYTLRNLNHGTAWNANQRGWYEMRDDLEAASQGFKNNRQLRSELRGQFEERVKPIATRWEQRRAAGASQDELNSIAQEYTREWDAAKVELDAATRTAYVGQYHSWYRSNAGAYGFEYEFTPANTRTRKSAGMDEIGKSDGEIVLDRKIKEDVDEIVADIVQGYPRTLAKSFDEIMEIEKFNPYHDSRGRFSTSSGYASFTVRTKDPSKQHMADMAIAREKERAGAGTASPNPTNDPETIAGAKRGPAMTHQQADEGRANPQYGELESADSKMRAASAKLHEAIRRGASAQEKSAISNELDRACDEYNRARANSRGYRENCQSCVVAYEARLRGYDVEAQPRTRKNQTQERLALHQENAWINPDTGAKASVVTNDPSIRTSRQIQSWVDQNVEAGARYTFAHGWKGTDGRSGHIVTVTRGENNALNIFDPQSGKLFTGDAATEYLGRVRGTYNNGRETKGRLELIRVDNMQINPDVANAVLRGAGQ